MKITVPGLSEETLLSIFKPPNLEKALPNNINPAKTSEQIEIPSSNEVENKLEPFDRKDKEFPKDDHGRDWKLICDFLEPHIS